MAYLLLITSWAERDLIFARIDIEDTSSGAVLVSHDRRALEDPARLRSTRLITGEPSPAKRALPAGRTAILCAVGPVAMGSATPKSLRHRFTARWA